MSPAGMRALVVDDEKFVRLLSARALANHRIVCDTAEDGAVAARMLDSATYDAVITDLRMPNVNGHALCQALLGRADRPVIVVITGLADPRLARDLQARGVDAIIHKPIDFPNFGKQVRALIETRRAARARPAEPAPQPAASEEIGLIEPEPPTVPCVAILMRHEDRAQRLAAALAGDSLTVFIPKTTDDLGRFVNEQRVDFLLIENAQYGFLKGSEILARVQQSSMPPQAVVVGGSDAFTNEEVQLLRIRTVFAGDATDGDLVQSIRSALADVERGSKIDDTARALVKAYGAPAHSPLVLLKLVDYVQLEPTEIPIEQLARDILASPATTAEILRLANGSSQALRRQITEVWEALNYLGAGRAVSLLLSSGVRTIERSLLRSVPSDVGEWYQMRTMLVASVASVFAERHFDLSADTAFVLGLFQDMGILVLANAFGERYLKLLEQARTVGPVRLHAIEQQYFNVNHAEVSAALLELWRLPAKLIPPIRAHHDASISSGDRKSALAFVRPMRIGEAFADLWDNRQPTRKDAMSRLLRDCGGGEDVDYQDSLAKAIRKTAEFAALFLLPHPDENAALTVCKEILTAYGESLSSSPEPTGG